MDLYKLLHQSNGRVIGMQGEKLSVILTGDSAYVLLLLLSLTAVTLNFTFRRGANIATAMFLHILAQPASVRPPIPVAMVFAYPAFDFNFSSWMSPDHLRVLRQESSANLPGILEQKDHMSHRSPLSVVGDRRPPRRKSSWSRSFGKMPFRSPSEMMKRLPSRSSRGDRTPDAEGEDEEYQVEDQDKSLDERVLFRDTEAYQDLAGMESPGAMTPGPPNRGSFGTRLTMTSRTGFFNDRIISPR
jgi:hypothetical protein